MRLRVCICVSALAFTPALFAQVRLRLADAVSEALSGHPELSTAAARVAVAEGLRHQAALKPNPRLILQSENARFNGSPPFSYPRDADSYGILAQTIETGGKRHRRVELATENVRRAELEQQLHRRQITSRVTAAYWTAVGAVRNRDLLRQEAANFESVVQFHRDRVREGASPEVDLLRVQIERDRLAASAATAAQDAERARIALLREMGKTQFPPVEFADALDPVRPVPLLTMEDILERRPEMRISRTAIEQAHANLRLQQANAKTDPDAQLGYKRTAGFNTLYAAIQLPLPIRNKNQGHIEAAAAEIKIAESSLAATEALLRSDVEAALTDYESRRRLLTETLQQMRDRADEVYRIAEAAYREGGTDVLRLLDAGRTRIEAHVAYTRNLIELQQSAVSLAAAQGNLP
ncbi:MAG TPA: TolC family protein [Bryobacteraceae bacterium]|nr:TolC family protein [Bryobacteraceae bacterium]